MRFELRARLMVIALSSVALGACLSGQTGSPDCVGSVSCVCDPLYGDGTLLRVRAERVEPGKLEAVVDEVFTTTYGDSSVVVGDRVGGYLRADQPCPPGDGSALQPDRELLVLYSPGRPQQGGVDLLDGVFSYAIAWGDTLSFGESIELSSSELSVMSSPESCLDRFPSPSAPPCHDTQTGVACSAAPHAELGGPSAAATLLALVALLGVRARRRRGAATGRLRPERAG
jgi:MYXO-CTERM domain-containing protein